MKINIILRAGINFLQVSDDKNTAVTRITKGNADTLTAAGVNIVQYADSRSILTTNGIVYDDLRKFTKEEIAALYAKEK